MLNTEFYVLYNIVSLKKELLNLVMDIQDEPESKLPRDGIARRVMEVVNSVSEIEGLCSGMNN